MMRSDSNANPRMTCFQDSNVRHFVGHSLLAKEMILKNLYESMEKFRKNIFVWKNNMFEKTISNVPIYKDDFICPKWKSPTESFPFYEFTFKLIDKIPDKSRKIILPNNEIANRINKIPVLENELMTDNELVKS